METYIEQHLLSTAVLESIGKVEISTINLAQSTPFWTGYETCLFWGSGSEVVATYGSWEEAVNGHATWANTEVLAKWFTCHVRLI